jgi:hypothetical protein
MCHKSVILIGIYSLKLVLKAKHSAAQIIMEYYNMSSAEISRNFPVPCGVLLDKRAHIAVCWTVFTLGNEEK